MEKEHYIREHMKAAGIGIVELSRRMGMHRQTVYTAIDKSSITLQTLHRIAAALDIEAYRLLLPPDDTRQDTHTDGHTEATERATEHTAAHRQEETRPGTYTRCICPHCHSVLRLMADEWRQPPEDNQTEETRRQAAGELRGVPDGDKRHGSHGTHDRQEQTEKRVCNI